MTLCAHSRSNHTIREKSHIIRTSYKSNSMTTKSHIIRNTHNFFFRNSHTNRETTLDKCKFYCH